MERHMFDPWVEKIPWRRKWQFTQVLLLGESQGQQSLVDCSQWGHKELDVTEKLTHTHICINAYVCVYIIYFFILFSFMIYHGTLNIVPCAIQQGLAFIHSVYNGNPKLPTYPSFTPPPW